MSLSHWIDVYRARRPWLVELRSSETFIVFTVALAIFTDIFLYGVIVPVLPYALPQRFGLAEDKVQYWVSVLIAVYGAALLAASPPFGWYADRSSSRQIPFFFGIFALAGATLMFNVGRSIPILVVARLLQGVAAACVWCVGLALVTDTVKKENNVGRAMGYCALGMSLGILLSPLVGGIVFDHGGYHAVFAVCYALLGLDTALRLLIVEKKVAARWLCTANTDPATRKASVASVEEGITAVDHKSTMVAIALPAINLETQCPETETPPRSPRRRDTLPPILSLLLSRRLVAALYGSLVQAALMTCFDSVLTIHAQRIFAWPSSASGLLFLPLVIPSFLSPLVGMLSDRVGPRWPSVAGFALSAPLFVCLRFITHDTLAQKVLLCVLLALLGLALTLCMTPLMLEITLVVEAKEREQPGRFGAAGAYAQAYGLFNMAFAGGCVLGPLWGGLIVEAAGWGTMSWSMGVLSLVSVVPVFLWVGRGARE